MLSSRLTCCFGLLLWAGLLVLGDTGHAQVTEAEWPQPAADVTVSATEQFRVYGQDSRSRGALASFAERQKTSFLEFIGEEKDLWHHLIVLRVDGKLTDSAVEQPIDWSVNQFGKTFALELKITLATNFNREELRDRILHMLMFERALRNVEVAVTDQLIPRWLQEGIPGVMRLRREGRPSHFFRKMFELNMVAPAGEILNAAPADSDPVSRAVFAASASGFVMMLLDQQDGAAKVAKLIHAHGGGHGARGHDLLARYFPSLRGTAERLERNWILYCAKLAAPQALEFLDADATEVALTEALQLRFLEFGETPPEGAPEDEGDKKGGFFRTLWNRESSSDPNAEAAPEERPTREFTGTLADFERVLPRQDRAEILGPARQLLLQLGFRSFPLYRPLVNDYLQVVGDLMAGKKRGIQDRLDELATERERLRSLLTRVHQALDDFEENEWNRKSGIFQDYLERARSLETDVPTAADPIAKYMDEVERALAQ